MSTIDLALAKAMVASYTLTRRTLINKTYGINDTKGIWFSIADMNAFMASLTPNITGVRFYLGVTAANDIVPNQTSIVFIGTVDNGSGQNVDPIGQNAQTLTDGGGQDPFNHGSLCPPAYDCV